MNQLSTYRWTIDEDLFHYQRAGFAGIGVWRRKLSDFGVERSVELLADSPMKVSNLLWAGGFTGNDGRSLEESVADATRAIELAEAINAACLVVYTGGRNLHTRRHANRLVRSALEDLLPVAEARGVTLAIEPMHAACAGEWTLLTSLESARDLIDEYASERLKLVFDTYHFPDTPLDQAAELAPRTAVVHLADIDSAHSVDQDRRLPGEGRAPLADLVEAFVANNFDGFFDVEVLGVAATTSDYEGMVRRSARGAEKMLAACVEPLPSLG
ncbi:MAG: sugar phosphate isomerase/epimerase family protein [Planctomycetota bacterium]